MLTYDLNLLRSLVLVQDLGSLSKAAEAQSRTESALSMQLRRLEELSGTPLHAKVGRRLVLTPRGRLLVAQARKLLALNDSTVHLLREGGMAGKISLGVPQDLAETWLPGVLADFSRAHPKVELQVIVGRNAALHRSFEEGGLDVFLAWSSSKTQAGSRRVESFDMAWLGPTDAGFRLPDPITLVIADGPCLFHKAGAEALRKADRAARVVIESASLSAIWAGVAAGLGITIRTRVGFPASVRILDAKTYGLPPLPSIHLLLRSKRGGLKAGDALCELLLDRSRKTRQ